ncbi:MAG: FAD-dependent oxidoreductase [Propionibacteriales bacterium]|nr:FAD-dependent oxidoreductase [Propionibacteriales bacterium]
MTFQPADPRTSLNAARRRHDLDAVADDAVDLLVVGLGITGVGVALDAASRGLSVLAVDAHDLAFGTSRWSSKLVHGGLRYLAQGDVGLAWASARERDALMRHIAPHLVSPLPMIFPAHSDVSHVQSAAIGSALVAGEALRAAARTGRAYLPRPRRLTATEALRLAPGLRRDGLRHAWLGWDGQLSDDARLVVAVARTAAGLGARIVTRCRAVGLHGRGAELRDELTGETFSVRAGMVVNATGVWAGQLAPDIALRPSRGSHLVFRSEAFPGGLGAAITTPVPGSSSRFVFALPQPDGRVYVGLTDEPADGPIPDVPTPSDAEVDMLLSTMSAALATPLTRDDVVGSFAGLRPLLAHGPDPTIGGGARSRAGNRADLSRRHVVHASADGVVTVVGGKLTTYRRMAADAVDLAAATRAVPVPPSGTARLPLVGAASPRRLASLPVSRSMVWRYGTEAAEVQALDPDPLAAQLIWGARHEGALDIDDLLDRRTRVGLVGSDRDAATAAARDALAGAAV